MVHILPKSIVLSFIFLIFSGSLIAQVGGRGTYDFLTVPYSARIAAMGGDFVAIRDHDVTTALFNPSLISPEMSNNLGIGLVTVASAYKYGFLSYARDFKKTGSFAASLQYINYGKFEAADETGLLLGTFSASEYALNIGWGRALSTHFFIGANGKIIYSQLEAFNSLGLAVDVAGTYKSTDNLFTASIIAKNIGSQLISYVPGRREVLPFELQAGISAKMKHIPLLFSVLYNNIEKWDLSYNDPLDPANQTDPLTGEIKSKSGVSEFADNMMRHIVVGTELTIAKALSIRLGYNYKRRQEMQLPDHKGMSGISYGFGLRVKMFGISYARTTYMAGGVNPNYFTITANLGQFSRKETAAPEQTQ